MQVVKNGALHLGLLIRMENGYARCAIYAAHLRDPQPPSKLVAMALDVQLPAEMRLIARLACNQPLPNYDLPAFPCPENFPVTSWVTQRDRHSAILQLGIVQTPF